MGQRRKQAGSKATSNPSPKFKRAIDSRVGVMIFTLCIAICSFFVQTQFVKYREDHRSGNDWRATEPVAPSATSTIAGHWTHPPLCRNGRNCSVDHLSPSSWAQFFKAKYHLQQPAILQGWAGSEVNALQEIFERDRLIDNFGHMHVVLGTHADLSEKGPGGNLQKTLQEYIVSMSNQSTHYLFDDGRFMRSSHLDVMWTKIPSGLGSPYTPPKLTLALGNSGQGLTFHCHMDSYSLLLHGRKRWAIYAPGEMTRTGYAGTETLLEWMERRREADNFNPPTWEFMQEAGEIVYVPEGFYHAVMNVGDAIAFVHQANWPTQGSLWHRFYRAKHLFHHQKNPKAALAELEELIHLDPTNLEFFMVKSQIYHHRKSLLEAVEVLEHMLTLNPLYLPAIKNLLFCLQGLGKMKEAVALIEQVVRRGLWLPEAPETRGMEEFDINGSPIPLDAGEISRRVQAWVHWLK